MEQDVDSSDIILERIIMSYVKPGRLSNVDKEFGDKYNRARRSTETRRLSEGTTSMDKPFYISKDIGGDHHASIYNDSTPNQLVEGHWINGIETETKLFSRGEVFTDAFYDEGCTHFYSYVLKELGMIGSPDFGLSIRESSKGYCYNSGGDYCVAKSSYVAKTDRNFSADMVVSWSISNGPAIVSGQGTDTVVIATDSNTSRSFMLTVTVVSGFVEETISEVFTHTRSVDGSVGALYPAEDLYPNITLYPGG